MYSTVPVPFIRVDQTDPVFRMFSGPVVTSRAVIEVDENCRPEVAQVLIDAMNRGWIRPVAYMHEHDYLANRLKQ